MLASCDTVSLSTPGDTPQMLVMLENNILGLVGRPLVVWGSDSLLCPHPMYRAPSYMLTPRVTLREGEQLRAEGEMALTQSCSGDEDPLSVVCFCRSPILQNETDVHSNEVPFFRSESHC